MSLPPPPGLQQQQQQQQQQHQQSPRPSSSLPPRPPSSFASQPALPTRTSSNAGHVVSKPPTGFGTFTSFQPRAVASTQHQHQPYRSHSQSVPVPGAVSSPATPTVYSANYQPQPQPQTQYSQPSYQAQPTYYGQQHQQQQQQQQQPQQQQHYGSRTYGQSSAPNTQTNYSYQNRAHGNSGYSGAGGRHGDSSMDPETEAQIAQWQSAYMSKDSSEPIPQPGPYASKTGITGRRDGGTFSATGANAGPLGNTPTPTTSTPTIGPQAPAPSQTPTTPAGDPNEPAKTVVRSGGGQTWTDSTLLEWDPAHFRLFCGNLAGEVTDDSLYKAFSRYPSVQKARVIRDRRTEKSKGYGFVSFSDGDDYFRAAREMQSKYIGSHPVLLRRAMTEIRPTTATKGGKGGKHGGAKGNASGSGAGGGGSAGGKPGKPAGARVAEGGVQKKQGKTRGGLKVLG